MTRARSSRMWTIMAGLAAAGVCATASAGGLTASHYLLTATNVPHGFTETGHGTQSAMALNRAGALSQGSCAITAYVHFIGGAYVVFRSESRTQISEAVQVGTTTTGTRLNASRWYAQWQACRTYAMGGLSFAIAPIIKMHALPGGARVGVLLQRATGGGRNSYTGIGIAQRGPVEAAVYYAPSTNPGTRAIDARTRSFTLLAIWHFPTR